MTPRLFTSGVVAISLFAAACGGGDEVTPAAEEAANMQDNSTPTSEPGVATGQVAAGQVLRSDGGRLEVAGTGPGPLDVTIREAKSPPAAPKGWQLVTPVYEVTAHEPGRGALVTQLKEPLELRVTTTEPLATFIYFDGDSWEIVGSDLVNGVVVALVDRLTPYAAAKPMNAGTRAAATASATRPAATVAAQTPSTPAGSATVPPGTATSAPAPSRSATAATVSAEAAKAALESAVSKYKGRTAKVVGAAGYSGAGRLAVPPQVTAALADASLYGDLHAGMYNGVNEAFTATSGAGSASFILLIEPKTEFPSSSSRAQELLAGYFPRAAGVGYVAIQAGPATYTYQGSNGSAFFVVGFTQQDGVPLAFFSTGSGRFTPAAVSVK